MHAVPEIAPSCFGLWSQSLSHVSQIFSVTDSVFQPGLTPVSSCVHAIGHLELRQTGLRHSRPVGPAPRSSPELITLGRCFVNTTAAPTLNGIVPSRVFHTLPRVSLCCYTLLVHCSGYVNNRFLFIESLPHSLPGLLGKNVDTQLLN